MPFESHEFSEARFLFDSQGRVDVSKVYICVDNDSLGLFTALALHRHVGGQGVPIIVRMIQGMGLAALLRQDGMGEFTGLHAFPMLDRLCNSDLLFAGAYEKIARAIHLEYVRKHRQEGVTREDNPAIASWDELTEDYRQSNRAQAAHIGVKLKAVGWDLAPLTDKGAKSFEMTEDEVELLSVMEHDRWVDERLRAGWTHGPKDAKRRKSPYLVPWNELPAPSAEEHDIREIDRTYIRNLPRFLAKAGFRIIRVDQR
jgi:hypothetical protein